MRRTSGMTFNGKSKIYPDGTAASHAYAPDGKPLRTTRASGRWAENRYDAQNRLIETSAGMTAGQPPEDASFFTYAPLSRLAAASNAVASYAYAHSALGVVTNETVEIGALAFTLERGIDERSRISSLNIAPNGVAESYAYDNEGRLNVISNAAFTLTYAYGQNRVIGYDIEIAGGAPSNSVLTRSITRARAYPDRITEITHTFDGAPISRRISDHDLIGRKTDERAIGANTHTNNYAYNKRSELSEAKYGPLPGSATTLTDKFNYDGIGNLHTTLGLQTTTYAANALNQYTQIKEGNTPPSALTYDPDGNLLTDGALQYTWDSAGRLSTVHSGNTCVISNAYDHAGRRITKTTFNTTGHQPLATSHFIYDGWNPILEIIAHTGGAVSTNQYFWGLDITGSSQGAGGVGGLVAVSLDGTLYFPLTDSNGNITEYIDTTGATVAQFRYDAYGATQEESGSMTSAFPFRFSTKYQDPETTLYYYVHRFYSPSLRRWINRDPIGEDGGLNLYGFCGNDTVNNFDILGMSACKGRVYITNKGKEITSADQVEVETSTISDWGRFAHNVRVCSKDPRSIEIHISITISDRLQDKLPSGTKVEYIPHRWDNIKGKMRDGTSIHGVKGATIDHEKGHLKSWWVYTRPRVVKELTKFLTEGNLTDEELKIKAAYTQVIYMNDLQNASANAANEAEINWFNKSPDFKKSIFRRYTWYAK